MTDRVMTCSFTSMEIFSLVPVISKILVPTAEILFCERSLNEGMDDDSFSTYSAQ